MKKVLLGSLIAVAIFTGCSEEKKAPITETTQEVKKDDTSTTSQTPVATEEKKEETK